MRLHTSHSLAKSNMDSRTAYLRGELGYVREQIKASGSDTTALRAQQTRLHAQLLETSEEIGRWAREYMRRSMRLAIVANFAIVLTFGLFLHLFR